MSVWGTNPRYEGVDIDDPSTADVVIKPSAGSAAPTLQAEDLMERTIGKLFAVDAVPGHGDRLCQVNTGTIPFHVPPGRTSRWTARPS